MNSLQPIQPRKTDLIDDGRPVDLELPAHALRAPAVRERLLEQADRLPLLIAGVAGVPGYNGFFQFRDKYGSRVIGSRPRRNWRLASEGIVGCDLENPDETRALIEAHGIKTIWHCGGSCALKGCELDPQMAHRVNVESVRSLLQAIRGTDVRLVHFSVDLVYAGTGTGSHKETEVAVPISMYGKTMRLAESLILDQCPEACILRISLPMGVSFNGHAGAIDWIQSRFAKDRPATLYFDEIRTPTYVECLNEVVEEVLASQLSGLFHAGGPRKLSLYEIAQIVNRVGGYDPDLLQGCPRVDAGPTPPRAGNVSMCSDELAKVLGRQPFMPWPLHESLVPDSRDWHRQTANAWQGCPELLAQILYRRPLKT